jgi:hypothetical protein
LGDAGCGAHTVVPLVASRVWLAATAHVPLVAVVVPPEPELVPVLVPVLVPPDDALVEPPHATSAALGA